MKKAILVVLAIAAVLLVIHLMPSEPPPTGAVPPGARKGDVAVDPATGETNVVVETAAVVDGEKQTALEFAPAAGRSLERHPLEPEATKRLHNGPVTVTSVLETTGTAQHGTGVLVKGAYCYSTTVKALSEVVEKEESPDGAIRVVERRRFLLARDHLALSDLDAVVDLSTLPLETLEEMAKGACSLVTAVSGLFGGVEPSAASMAARAGVELAFRELEKIDGASARRLLGDFDVAVPENIEKYLNDRISKLASEKFASVHSAIQSIEGKAYVITYTQDAKGQPLKVDFVHEGGEGISGAEWEILRTANAFLDQNIVPDTRCEVGDSWTVWADEMQELFGLSSGQGKADGTIRVARGGDREDGDWTLVLEPSEIAYRGAKGAGTLEVLDGTGLVDAGSASVRAIQATASGDMQMLDKNRHFLFFDFVKKTSGNASMRFTLATGPADAP